MWKDIPAGSAKLKPVSNKQLNVCEICMMNLFG